MKETYLCPVSEEVILQGANSLMQFSVTGENLDDPFVI